ncbi:MAG: KEOPS complex subunit Cgi121 [Ferroplasma sp.]|uniref:KEOPS complex subunit Cgi121 n=1 Tax=Ferroplasma sp. TaxID=2591003 RepID=UPI002814AC54|nr:KEOPS complex subunit Cgi121 [Ferroplasma sp.]WMT51934.1 MAG: KEOPS complex subunit Cgi121 [Ferroplasma sp.]
MLHKISYFSLNKFDEHFFDFFKNNHGLFQLIDASTIISEVQIIEAIRKTERYISYNEKIRFPGTVLLMYIAGTNQINVAIKKCGINEKTKRGIAVYSNPEDLDTITGMGYITTTDRFLPFDVTGHDFQVFSEMARVDFTL